MRRFCSSALKVVLCGALLCAPLSQVDAKGETWSDIAKKFKKTFRFENSVRDRTLAVLKVSKSSDYRGVAVLLSAYKSQLKQSIKVFKKWEKDEAEWKEKTDKMLKRQEDIFNREIERAKKKGRKPPEKVTIPSDVADWLGASGRPGKSKAEKQRIGNIYSQFGDEETFSKRILQEMARLVNSLSGEEREKGNKAALSAVRGASKKNAAHIITLLGFLEGDEATTALMRIADSTKGVEELQEALGALGRQNTESGKAYLIKQLGHASWTVRGAALYGLSFYKDAGVMDALLAHAPKEEGVLRRRVFGAMSSIVESPVMATMDAWISWWKANRKEWTEKWAARPNKGKPILKEPTKFPLKTSSHKGSTSFYGIKTDSKHIIFVVDVSGSMGPGKGQEDVPEEKQRIGVARKELLRAIQGMSAVDEDERGAATFNVVTFSTKIDVFKAGSMVVATKKNKEKAIKWINKNIKPQMQTDIFGGLEKAFNIISESKEKKNMAKGADTIFLMTDGAPSTGKFTDAKLILAEVARMNKIRQLSIHTIGVGKGHYVGFLKQLAADNHGQYIARDE